MEPHLSKMLQVQLFQLSELKEESQHKLAIIIMWKHERQSSKKVQLANSHHHLYFINTFSDGICTVFLNVYFWVILSVFGSGYHFRISLRLLRIMNSS